MKDSFDKVKHFIIIVNSVMGIFFGFVFGIRVLFIDEYFLAIADFILGAGFIFVLIYSLKRPGAKFPYYFSVSLMFIFFIYLFATGGAENTGYLWSVIIPLCSIFMLGWKPGVFYSVGYFLSMCVIICLSYFGFVSLNIPHQEIISRLFSIYIIASIVAVAYEISKKKVEDELISARKRADEANQAKSEFLAIMSHEIRTPLFGVMGSTELLLKTGLNKSQKEYADMIDISGKNLLNVLNDILDFSKIEAGMLDIDIVETDIFELIDMIMKINSYHAVEKGLEMKLDMSDEIPKKIMTDPVRLRQIILNLMSNAIKFTDKGEIELKVLFKPLVTGRGRFTFSVRDTGIGISDDQKTKLFQAFTQVDSSTTRMYGGTGLGLMISKLLVEKMGGTISLESSPGKGSIFYFEIDLDYCN